MTIHSRTIRNRREWLEWRKQNLNASEIAALFGPDVHPYLTPYKLWNLKCEAISDEADNPTLRRGKKFEPVVIDCLREDHPDWELHQSKVYLHDDETRLGATPDVYATRPDLYGAGIIQIKTVGAFAFERKWHDAEGVVRVPTWIAVQASVEAYLAAASWAAVAAMRLGDGGIDIIYVDIPLKPGLIHRLEDLAADFWRRVTENDPYDPDFGRDRKLILDLYREGDGSVLDLTGDEAFYNLVDHREVLHRIEKHGDEAGEERKTLDAQIIHRLGNASAARLGETIVRVSMVRKKPYIVKATQYPLVKVKGFKNE
jgi:putative phage-type endonuclease